MTCSSNPPETALHSYPVTYGTLKAQTKRAIIAEGHTVQYLRNQMSALNGWMAQLGATDDSFVGVEFGTAFDDTLQDHVEFLRAKPLAERTIRDRLEQLIQWRDRIPTLASLDTLPEAFGQCLSVLVERRGLPLAELAQRVGMTVVRLKKWVSDEKKPWRGNVPEIAMLAQELGVSADTLAARLPARRITDVRRPERVEASGAPRTEFQKRMSEMHRKKFTYRLMNPPEPLRREWRQLVRFKTVLDLPDGWQRTEMWRMKPLAKVGHRVPWFGMAGSLACPTASACWTMTASYLGFLALSPDAGGRGEVLDRVASLALLSDASRISQYVEWRRERSEGKVHRGMVGLVTIAMSFLRPATGFLWQVPEFLSQFPEPERIVGPIPPDSPEQAVQCWRRWCETNHDKLRVLKARLTKPGVLQKARDPKEALRAVLADARPIDVAMRLITEMERTIPSPSSVMARAVRLRDILLLKMLISNPLRAQHFSTMTYSGAGAKNIYQTPSGAWRLRFDASDFKNARGAAKEEYDVAIPQTLWPEIERYLFEARPVLCGSVRTDYMFVSAETGRLNGRTNPDGMWTIHAISCRVRLLWRMFMPDMPGYGPHGFRAIVATDYLRRFPGDYPNVARLLHDTLETVLREYGYLEVDDGLKRLHSYVEQAWSHAGAPAR